MAASAIHDRRSISAGFSAGIARSAATPLAPREAIVAAKATSTASPANPTDHTHACVRSVSMDSRTSG